MTVMKEEHHREGRIRKGRTNHQGATQSKDIKIMFVNGERTCGAPMFGFGN